MSIPLPDTKMLWARSAGICSNRACREDLTIIESEVKPYVIGEMAHVIAEKEDGPRGQKGGGENVYENLILLCPTCHRRVDKSPGDYPAELLHKWKSDHEAEIRQRGAAVQYETRDELAKDVCRLLMENRAIWKEFGPESTAAQTDPGSNLHQVWEARKLDRVIPNNWEILNRVEANKRLLLAEDFEAYIAFKNHAGAFEMNQYGRLDSYPTFPRQFDERFCG